MGKEKTLEDFIKAYVQNKEKTSTKEGYADWLLSNGVNSGKIYSESIKDISGDYARAKSDYGKQAERLGELGLSASGYSDYIKGSAYSAMQKRKAGARNAYYENEQKNQKGYQDYLKNKADEAYKTYNSVIEEIKDVGILDYEEAYGYASEAGLAGELADSAAKKATEYVHKKLYESVLSTAIKNGFVFDQTKEYAKAVGLGDDEADELAEYAEKINKTSYYTQDYLDYLEQKKKQIEGTK